MFLPAVTERSKRPCGRASVLLVASVALLLAGCRTLPPTATDTTSTATQPVPETAVTAVPPTETDTPAAIATPVFHADRSRPYVALTSDACQDESQPTGYDSRIVDILTATDTPATLFLGGLWVRHHAQVAAQLGANPLFELGNHSWSHPDFTTIDATRTAGEISRTQSIIQRTTGQTPVLFRFPYGRYDTQALALVSDAGLTAVQWDVESGDPDAGLSVGDLIDGVENETRNGSIIIMHLNGNGQHTAEALVYVIRNLRQRGFRFVTMSELLAEPAEIERQPIP